MPCPPMKQLLSLGLTECSLDTLLGLGDRRRAAQLPATLRQCYFREVRSVLFSGFGDPYVAKFRTFYQGLEWVPTAVDIQHSRERERWAGVKSGSQGLVGSLLVPCQIPQSNGWT